MGNCNECASGTDFPTKRNRQGNGTQPRPADSDRLSRSPAAPGQLRLLCLHGYGANNEITEVQALSLRLSLPAPPSDGTPAAGPSGHGVACDFLEAAPLASREFLETAGLGLCSERPLRGWLPVPVVDQGEQDAALAAAVQDVMDVVERYGPYDGIYGYSQGTVVVSCLCSPTVWRGMFSLNACPFRFALCANAGAASLLLGSKPAEAPLEPEEKLTESRFLLEPAALAPLESIALPSFHIIGRVDQRWADDGIRLAENYVSARVQWTEFGHELPMALWKDEAMPSALGEFLDQFRKR